MCTYLFDGLLRFFHLAELDVAEAEKLKVWSDGDLAAQDLSEGAEPCIEILVMPVRLLEALDEDGSALDVSATWLSSDGVHVVGENPAHVSSLDPGIPVVLHCLLRILDAVEHDEGVVVVLEQRSILRKKS